MTRKNVNPMKFFLKCLLVFVISLILGAGSAGVGIRKMFYRSAVSNGPWRALTNAGSRDADMYTRAAVAVGGLFALDKSETIYYTAFEDSAGQRLRSDCVYIMSGTDIDARWWSFTVYGSDHYLIPNEHNRYAYNAANLAREADGSYVVKLGGTATEGNWIPTGESGSFSITLRVYNPSETVYGDLAGVELPTIRKEASK